jgi:hypothetical protein
MRATRGRHRAAQPKIVANLPYLQHNQRNLYPELRVEPEAALRLGELRAALTDVLPPLRAVA